MLEILPGFSRNGLHDDKVRQNFIDNNSGRITSQLLRSCYLRGAINQDLLSIKNLTGCIVL
jgi:hypothetical protein